MNRRKAILVAFFSMTFLYSLIHLGIYTYDHYHTAYVVKGLERQMNSSAAPALVLHSETSEVGVEKARQAVLPQLGSLARQNQDIAGWLSIEGTPIHYPVMHTPQDAEFYLDHGFDRRKSKSGLPFLDSRSSIAEPTTNWIIHGHNMKNGSMFHALTYYKNKDYYEKHPIIQFDTLYEHGEYEVIAVILSKVYRKDEQVFKYYQFINAETKTEFDAFIQNIKQLALYNTGISAEYGDQLITLSTCEYSNDNGRLAVIARRSQSNSSKRTN